MNEGSTRSSGTYSVFGIACNLFLDTDANDSLAFERQNCVYPFFAPLPQHTTKRLPSRQHDGIRLTFKSSLYRQPRPNEIEESDRQTVTETEKQPQNTAISEQSPPSSLEKSRVDIDSITNYQEAKCQSNLRDRPIGRHINKENIAGLCQTTTPSALRIEKTRLPSSN